MAIFIQVIAQQKEFSLVKVVTLLVTVDSILKGQLQLPVKRMEHLMVLSVKLNV